MKWKTYRQELKPQLSLFFILVTIFLLNLLQFTLKTNHEHWYLDNEIYLLNELY